MKFILTLFALACLNIGSAQITLGDDGLHFGTGALISAATYTLVYSKTKNKKKAFWYSLGLSTLAGLSKEIYDGYIISGYFDKSEFIATIAGGLTASYSFDIFTGKKNKERKKKKTELAFLTN